MPGLSTLGLLIAFSVSSCAACPVWDRLPVKLFDDAVAGDRVLHAAKEEAERLLRSVCVEVEWVHCRVIGFAHSEPCAAPAKAMELHVLASPRTDDSSENALGVAFPTLSSRGNAAVFLSRVRETVASNPGTIDVPRLLGHVMAHEMGHLLLRSSTHSAEGVMRAKLRPADLRKAAKRQLTFTREQGELIRRKVIAQERSVGAVQP